MFFIVTNELFSNRCIEVTTLGNKAVILRRLIPTSYSLGFCCCYFSTKYPLLNLPVAVNRMESVREVLSLKTASCSNYTRPIEELDTPHTL